MKYFAQIVQYISSFEPKVDRTKLGVVLFLIGTFIFIASQFYIVAGSQTGRALPVEVDDAYTYIVKAVQMHEGAFLQDTPALNDLRAQLTQPHPNKGIAWERYRHYHRNFVIYHPLHSLLLWGGHGFGLSWATAYNLLCVLGSVFIAVGIAFWLYTLWGYEAAGIALISLLFVVFQKQGLHYIVPSNLALGIAVFCWAYLMKTETPKRWVLLLFILAMLSMHPMGKLYALASLGIYLFSRPILKKAFITTGIGVSVVALTFVLPHIISRPELSIEPDPLPDGFSYWDGIRQNVQFVSKNISRVAIPEKALLPFLFTPFVGIFFAPSRKRRKIFSTFLLLLGLFVASLFYVLPRYPGEMVSRMFIPVFVLFSGAAGYTLWVTLQVLKGTITAWLKKEVLQSRITKPELLIFLVCTVCLLIGVFLVARKGYEVAVQRITYANKTVRYMKERQDFAFDLEQPELLLSRIQHHESVVYMTGIPMYLYFANGFYRYGAVFYHALGEPSFEEELVHHNRNAAYLVAYSPLRDLPKHRIPLSPSYPVIHLTHPLSENSLFLDCMTDATAGNLDMIVKNANGTETFSYPLQEVGNTKIRLESAELARNASITLSVKDANKPVYITSIQVQPDSHLLWPWDTDIWLEYFPNIPEAETQIIQFESEVLFSESQRPFKILSDKGLTILAEFTDL